MPWWPGCGTADFSPADRLGSPRATLIAPISVARLGTGGPRRPGSGCTRASGRPRGHEVQRSTEPCEPGGDGMSMRPGPVQLEVQDLLATADSQQSQGRSDEALSTLQRAKLAAQAAGAPALAAEVMIATATLLAAMGRSGEAIASLQEASRLFSLAGDQPSSIRANPAGFPADRHRAGGRCSAPSAELSRKCRTDWRQPATGRGTQRGGRVPARRRTASSGCRPVPRRPRPGD